MRDTRHFRHFRPFQERGSKPLVFVDRMHIRHFRHFRQNTLFSAGCKNPVWQKPRLRLSDLKEEGRATRNGYEASKGSKGTSGLLLRL